MAQESIPRNESERDRFLRRAREARESVARADHTLLDVEGVDQTLLDLTLSRSVMERLDAAYQNRLGMAWLQQLGSSHASGRR